MLQVRRWFANAPNAATTTKKDGQMSKGFAAALRRATNDTRAGRLLRRAFGDGQALHAPPTKVPPTLPATTHPDRDTPPPGVEPAIAAPVLAEPAPTEPVAADPATAAGTRTDAHPVTAVAEAPAQAATLVALPPASDAPATPPAASFPLSLTALPAAALAAPRGQLDDVIRLLSGRPRPSDAPTTLPLPEGAAWLARRFEVEAGARDYRLYVPATLDGPPRGLVLMLHGCTQNPEDFALGTGMNAMAEQERFIVAYPEQPQAQNANRCWNWFRPDDQRRGGGEPAILAGLAQALAAEHAVPHGRIFVAGLSAGGAMAAVLGEAYPDLFAAVGIHSGVACGSARDARSALAAMRGLVAAGGPSGVDGPRTIIFQGDADTTVHPSNATRLVVRAVGEGASGAWDTRAVGGRTVTRSVTRGTAPDSGEGDGDSAGTGREVELWMIEGAGHAWAGGNPAATYAEAEGPDASAEMVRFFLATAHATAPQPAVGRIRPR